MKEMWIYEHSDDAGIMDEETLYPCCFTESHIGLEGMECQCFEEFRFLTREIPEYRIHLMACED